MFDSGLGVFGVFGEKDHVGDIQNVEGILMNKMCGLGGGGGGGSRLVQYHMNGSC